MKMLLAVAFGGAFGALGRHFLSQRVMEMFGGGFPMGILVCNVVGSFLMGLLVEYMALSWSPSIELRALLTVGFLGAFTTFSTFSMDTVLLMERGQMGLAASYVIASVILSVGGLFAGMALVRTVLA